MITNIALGVFVGMLGSVAHAQGCEDWGMIEPGPDPDAMFIGDTYRFYVSNGASPCGDTEACEWSLDEANAVGRLLQTTGTPVQYKAPDMLEGCTPVSFQLFLYCPETAGDAINLTVQCTAAAKEELLAAPGSTVSGGGCTETGDLALLLPLGLFPLRRRRRSEQA